MMILYRFWNLLQNYRRDKTGSILVIFALVLVILIGIAGLAVDFSRKVSAQNLLSAALDAAALAAANSKDKSLAGRQAIANAIFEANLRNTVLGKFSIKPNINLKDKDGVLDATASLELPTTLLAVVGIKKMDIKADATVGLPTTKKTEIALVLDYSFSMDTDKNYVKMSKVVSHFVTNISTAALDKNAVKFSIVPFSGSILASLPSYALLGEGSSDRLQRFCLQDRGYPYNINGEAVDSSDASKWDPIEFNPYVPDSNRALKLALSVAHCKPYEEKELDLMPLTSDSRAILQKLAKMKPVADTHISAGFAFGYEVLSPHSIFGAAAPFGDATHKFLILMTDGAQTTLANGSDGTRSVPNGEANLVSLCNLARSKGIQVVTVAFMLNDAPTVARLKNCASSPDLAFNVGAADLTEAFDKITHHINSPAYLSK